MRDKQQQTTEQTVKIELLSQWKLEAEFRNICSPVSFFCLNIKCQKDLKMFDKSSAVATLPNN